MISLIPSLSSPKSRRHSDPPKLWLWVLAGSLLFHLIAWTTVQKILATSPIQAASTAIAVDFLEPVEESVPLQQTVKSNQTAEAETTSLQQTVKSNQTKSNQTAEAETTQTALSTPAIAPTQSVREPSVTIPTSKAPIQISPPKPTVPLVANPPINLQPKRPAATDAPIADTSAKKPVIATSNVRLPDVPVVPNPTDKEESNGAIREKIPTGIASVAIPSPAPAQFTAQFRAIGSTSNSSDSSTESILSARLDGELTKRFSSDPSICALTFEAFHSFGQPVKLQLTLSEIGTLDLQKLITVKQSSGNIQYDELAICVAKTSRFIPAYKLEGNTKRSIPSDLEIQVTLTQ